MSAPRVVRTLTAVLAADMVGYSRLMDRDERVTFERLKAHRKEVIESLLAQHRGRMVKLTGDGALCDFQSVVDAVACAILIQQAITSDECSRDALHSLERAIGLDPAMPKHLAEGLDPPCGGHSEAGRTWGTRWRWPRVRSGPLLPQTRTSPGPTSPKPWWFMQHATTLWL